MMAKITPIFDASARSMTGSTLPVGTVRIRKRDKRRAAVRMIKVRANGPISGRWIEFARWWWENNRGPVPAGKRVAHEDGDQLNDDPSNLVLATPGDIFALAFDREPGLQERNAANVAKASRRHNAERAAFRRLREWLPSKWYPVDVDGRIVLNMPARKRWMVYQQQGLAEAKTLGRNGMGIDAAAYGWPALTGYQASILSVLSKELDWMTTSELRTAVSEFRAARCLGDIERIGSFYSELHGLGSMVLNELRGCHEARRRISPSAISTRREPCRFVPIRGAALIEDERFAGFQKHTPGVTEEAA